MATTEQQSPAAVLEQAGLSVEQLYDELTDGCTKPVRLEELVYEAAERVPGLVPTRAEMEPERARKLADKEGLELAQGLLIAEFLANPRTGRHLVESMLRPTQMALEHLDELRSTRNASTSATRASPATAAPACSSCATRATSTPRTGTRWPRPRPPSTWSCSTPRSRSGCSAAAWSITRATRASASSAPAST